MFVVNGEILSKVKSPKPLYDWYQKKLNEVLNEDVNNFIFSCQKHPYYETDDSGRKRITRQYQSVPSSSTFWNEEMGESQSWVYAPSANAINTSDGVAVVKNKRPIIIGNSTLMDKKDDKEIIFFLLNISNNYRTGKIVRIDPRSENEEEAKKNALSAKAQYLIYAEDSPIHPDVFGTEKALRQLALSWGVVNALDMHIDEVRNKLWDSILKAEKTRDHAKRGFTPFINEVNKQKDSAKRANIITAINDGYLVYGDDGWTLEVEGTKSNICSVPPQMVGEKEDVVIEYILENPEYLALIASAVKKSEEKKENDKEPVNKPFDRTQGIKDAIELGWEKTDVYKMKNEKIKEIVNGQIKPADSE